DDFSVTVLTSHASQWQVGGGLPCPASIVLTSNADQPGTDTASDVDYGGTGRPHKEDPAHRFRASIDLDFGGGGGPHCGTCTVTGGSSVAQNACRCANDTQIVCTQPFLVDAAECGAGNLCSCYAQAPMPVVVHGSPACLVWLRHQEVSGTYAPTTGSGQLD